MFFPYYNINLSPHFFHSYVVSHPQLSIITKVATSLPTMYSKSNWWGYFHLGVFPNGYGHRVRGQFWKGQCFLAIKYWGWEWTRNTP